MDVREVYENTDWNGYYLKIKPFKGGMGLSAAYKFSKYISPSITAMTKNIKTDKLKNKDDKKSMLDMDLSELNLDNAVREFFSNCKEKEFIEFADTLLKRCEIGNQPVKMDDLMFNGRPELLLELLVVSVKYQFGGFFSALKRKLPSLTKVFK